MTNKELYELWQEGKAQLIDIYQADWDIEWEVPASNMSHEATIEYEGKQYSLFFQDNFDDDGNDDPIIESPNEKASICKTIDLYLNNKHNK